MGELLAENNYNLVYGGSDFGLMGEVAKAVKGGGGKVLGVMPKNFMNLLSTKAEIVTISF